ncbi:UNVERIFIED_CONTAM: La-related protein 6B [Sesamum indicum]
MMDQAQAPEALTTSTSYTTRKLNAEAPEFVPRSSATAPPLHSVLQNVYARPPPFVSPLPPAYYGYENFYQQPPMQFYGYNSNPLSPAELAADRNNGSPAAVTKNGLSDAHLKILNQMVLLYGDGLVLPVLNKGLSPLTGNLKFWNEEAVRYLFFFFHLFIGKLPLLVFGKAEWFFCTVFFGRISCFVVEFYFSDINLATTDQLFRFMSKDPEGYVPISVVASFKKIKSAINGSAELSSILQSSKKLLVSEDGKMVKRRQPLTESDMEELQVKPTQGRGRKIGNEGHPIGRKDEATIPEVQCSEESYLEDSQLQSDSQFHEHQGRPFQQREDSGSSNVQRKGRNNIAGNGKAKAKSKGKGQGRGRPQHPVNGGIYPPPIEVSVSSEKPTTAKTSPVPRMPDGTKGFSMGRGKPVDLKLASVVAI